MSRFVNAFEEKPSNIYSIGTHHVGHFKYVVNKYRIYLKYFDGTIQYIYYKVA